MQNAFGKITRPSVYMHIVKDTSSEVSDQLLYGTGLTVLKNENGICRCETDYGYSGYLSKKYIDFSDDFPCLDRYKYVIAAPFADLLKTPECKYRPMLTLHKGSVVESDKKISRCSSDFFPVMHMGKICYVPKCALRQCINVIDAISVNTHALRKRICDDALMYLGAPYRWGGKSPSGIDCSGLCFMAYFLNGIPLWRDAHAHTKYVREIDPKWAAQGDLIYFKNHMGLYIGDGEYVHASMSTGCVTVNSLYKNSIIYRRDLGDNFLFFARSVYL